MATFNPRLHKSNVYHLTMSTPNTSDHAENVFRKVGDYWEVKFQGLESHFKDSKGLFYVARLLKKPNVRIPAFDLAYPYIDFTESCVEENIAREAKIRYTASYGHQEVTDRKAIQDCQKALRELNENLEKTKAENDLGAQQKIESEISFFNNYIRNSLTPTGRIRCFPDDPEKARKSVLNAITRVLGRIEKENEHLYRHFANSIHTGRKCVYKPEKEMNWVFEDS